VGKKKRAQQTRKEGKDIFEGASKESSKKEDKSKVGGGYERRTWNGNERKKSGGRRRRRILQPKREGQPPKYGGIDHGGQGIKQHLTSTLKCIQEEGRKSGRVEKRGKCSRPGPENAGFNSDWHCERDWNTEGCR